MPDVSGRKPGLAGLRRNVLAEADNKPGSVPAAGYPEPQAMAIPLGRRLPAASSSQPGSTDGQSLQLPYLALLLVGFTEHPASPPGLVSSYLTLSPLPVMTGGLLSVALSLGSPPLDVIQHHALWSPDFPLPFYGQRPSCLLRPIQSTEYRHPVCAKTASVGNGGR